MGLFLGPFSGNAVGGGGHNTGNHGVMDPAPPGTDPESGPRSEVDTVNRSPLRLLRTTMNKHQPKFMKIVPPGQQRGQLAPPYAWNALERSDWRYESPKRRPLNGLKEGEFDATGAGGHATPNAGTATASKSADPRHARVEEIQKELHQLRQELHQLHARKKSITDTIAAGKAHLKRKPASPPPAGHWRGSAAAGYPEPQSRAQGAPIESLLFRGSLRLLEATPSMAELDALSGPPPEEKPKPRRSAGGMTSPPIQFGTKDDPFVPTHVDGPRDLPVGWLNKKERRDQLVNPAPLGLLKRPSAPPQSASLIKTAPQLTGIESEIRQKTNRVTQLTDELKGLRLQLQQAHESTGLRSNNLRRLGLLLK